MQQSPAKSSAATPERPPAQEPPAGEEQRGKRSAPAAGAAAAAAPAGPSSKRPRYEGKPFNELTVNDLEGIVREVMDLKRQVASRDEELAKLKETAEAKAALAKQLKAMEAELGSKQREADKLQSAVRDQDKDVSVQAERVKLSLKHQLASQIVWHSAFREQLQKEGREISAFVPNVSPEVLKALGTEPGTKTKYADLFFEGLPAKTAPIGKLSLVRNLTFKYVKATCELRVDSVYRVAEGSKGHRAPKKAAKKAPKKQARKSSAGTKSAEGAPEAEEEDDWEDDEEEDDFEDDEEGDAEAEAEAEVPSAEPAALAAAN